jgi:hypothetical protein
MIDIKKVRETLERIPPRGRSCLIDEYTSSETCYCALGCLMKAAGASDDELRDEDYNALTDKYLTDQYGITKNDIDLVWKANDRSTRGSSDEDAKTRIEAVIRNLEAGRHVEG